MRNEAEPVESRSSKVGQKSSDLSGLDFLLSLESLWCTASSKEAVIKIVLEQLAAYLKLVDCSLIEFDALGAHRNAVHKWNGVQFSTSIQSERIEEYFPNECLDGPLKLGPMVVRDLSDDQRFGGKCVEKLLTAQARALLISIQWDGLEPRWALVGSRKEPMFWESQSDTLLRAVNARLASELRWWGELKDSKNAKIFLDAILKKIPTSIAIFDTEMRLIQASQSWLKEFHLSGEALGRSHYELTPNLPEVWKTVHQRTLQGESLGLDEDSFVMGGEIVSWQKWRTFPWRKRDGTIGGMIGISQDVSEEKRKREALKKSEENFRLLAEAMPQIVWETDAAGMNTYFNQQWVEYTGLSLLESYGTGWNKPFHPEDQKRAWDAWQNATKNRAEYSLECRLKRRDGEYRWWLVRGVPVVSPEGSVLKWIGTCTDIHNMKQIQITSNQLAEQLQFFMDNAVDYAIFMLSPNGEVQSWNRGAERMKGYKTEEIIGKNFSVFFTHDDIEKNKPEEELRMALKVGNYHEEGVRVKKDGTSFWANVELIPLYDNTRKHLGFYKIVREITERKNMDEERSLREKSLLTIVHDLRNPLASIKMNTEMIQKSSMGLSRIIKGINRVDQMITDLMDASSIRAGGAMHVMFEACDLHQIAVDVLQDFSQIHGDRFLLKGVDSLSGYWSPSALRRLLENLLGNAVKYGYPQTPISVNLERQGESVLISVQNLGEVLSSAEISTLFNFRQRAPSAGKENVQGWGIGLTLVKGVVEAHGGQVQVRSSVEEGTVFTVTLPTDSRR